MPVARSDVVVLGTRILEQTSKAFDGKNKKETDAWILEMTYKRKEIGIIYDIRLDREGRMLRLILSGTPGLRCYCVRCFGWWAGMREYVLQDVGIDERRRRSMAYFGTHLRRGVNGTCVWFDR